jgi:hypothetical protein
LVGRGGTNQKIPKLPGNPDNVAEVLLSSLENVLGIPTFEALAVEIHEEYLGKEIDIHAAIIYYPELFERAIMAILGEAGEKMLAYIWRSKLCKLLDLSSTPSYENAGDLVKCIAAIRARSNSGLR